MGKRYQAKQTEPRPGGKAPWALVAVVAALVLLVAGTVALTRSGQTVAGAPDGSAAGPGPRVAVDRDRLDFGKVKMATPVTAVFKVKNVGDQPLDISGEPQVRVVEGC